MKSATQLGEPYGLTGQQMNYLLEREGYIEKDRLGLWSPTEKGEPYCHEPNYPPYYKGNQFNVYDESILDEFDLSKKGVKQIKKDFFLRNDSLKAETSIISSNTTDSHPVNNENQNSIINSTDQSNTGSDKTAIYIISGIGGVIAVTALLAWAVPKIKNHFSSKSTAKQNKKEPQTIKMPPAFLYNYPSSHYDYYIYSGGKYRKPRSRS